MSSPKRILDTASEWLYAAFLHPDSDVILTSPYLAFDVCKHIADAARDSSQSWTLLTTLDPSAVANGFLRVDGMKLMLDAGINVRHVQRLHAKCFIVGTKAMIGSANLTGAGLGSSVSANRELSVELDPVQAEEARKIISGWPSRPVSKDDLDKLLLQAKNLTVTVHPENEEQDAESALHLVEQLLVDARQSKRRLWVKSEYGEPALDGWRQDSWFASPKNGRPSFNPGDLVFICAVGTHDCYAVVEVTAEAEYKPQDYVEWTEQAEEHDSLERWPWINRTTPRLVPSSLLELKLEELGKNGRALQRGHVRLEFDQFTAGVRALGRLATD
ncbi:hypothetical protein CXX84_03915 [Arthrobacter sp. AFG7.2]|uniref:phospholipase D-like domain-containing protein n=1 Tax=Arthrobacter sp. AFG7.2 TaxID=1688693 RepID=UPI000C9DA7E8|nr:phospholipase D-like domain-containing protein [Arthrobacter sp. AFG7.2]PNI09421.1 hypothetical protein CXX84_03915 [Arthrobacter sp. AFG7.2]